MTEADFQTRFSRYIKYKLPQTAVWELKYCKGNSLPFTALKPHQKRALILAATQCIHYKIPDVGMSQKPCDGFTICNSPAYVVVQYADSGKEFYMIPIERWVTEEENSIRRSLTRERAKEIGKICRFG